MYRILCTVLLSVVLSFSLRAQTRGRIVEHTVREHETVYGLAQRYQTTTDKIYEINSWARSGIKVGDKLVIYTGTNKEKTEEQKQSSESQAKQSVSIQTKQALTHTIVAGETLYRITRTYGISEQDLIATNPGISATNFPIGVVLRIPRGPVMQTSSGATVPNKAPVKEDTLAVKQSLVAEVPPVKVLMMLPLRKAKRYLEFYQGFLMGMNDLKKDGININMTVLEANDDDAVAQYIHEGQLHGHDFVIGGINEEQNRQLAQAARSAYYIVPFTDVVNNDSRKLIQINQPQSEVISRVVKVFLERYGDKSIVFTRRHEDSEHPFAVSLKRALADAHISYKTVNISNTNLAHLIGKDDLIVPVSPSRGLAEMTLAAMGNESSQTVVFGYPQWQSYGNAFARLAHQKNVNIYSTFYFNKQTSESKQFLARFNAWFNKRVSDSYPKYSVLGYDLARYFIRAYAAYGDDFLERSVQLPSDGLQMDIELSKSTQHEGYTNSRFYLISYERDGSVTRQAY